jgi:hypothetical protein
LDCIDAQIVMPPVKVSLELLTMKEAEVTRAVPSRH